MATLLVHLGLTNIIIIFYLIVIHELKILCVIIYLPIRSHQKIINGYVNNITIINKALKEGHPNNKGV